ncbi:hypothetical protein TorRG33x02_013520 [Trema orientale]|uniref:Uncharacterized protein n=1 Tax=Trema orientale TaxID=63057 RepID=A0A2P5FZT2_TREOI|nr:hypothetical protein TorRG33x02_013520 [Trema orientale]
MALVKEHFIRICWIKFGPSPHKAQSLLPLWKIIVILSHVFKTLLAIRQRRNLYLLWSLEFQIRFQKRLQLDSLFLLKA